MPAGNESDPARVQANIGTSDGRSLLPNNLAIADAGSVQAVYHPRYIIDNKPTAFKLDLTSTHTTPVNATVTVQMSDGITTVSDSKPVVVPPEGLRVFLFDGSGTAAPFRPRKQPNLPRLQYSVAVDAPADSNERRQDRPIPELRAGCSDNALSGSAPMITTNSPRTLYLPWDLAPRPCRASRSRRRRRAWRRLPALRWRTSGCARRSCRSRRRSRRCTPAAR